MTLSANRQIMTDNIAVVNIAIRVDGIKKLTNTQPSAPVIFGKMVGVERFELPALWSQTRCATRLRYTPTDRFLHLITARFQGKNNQYNRLAIFPVKKWAYWASGKTVLKVNSLPISIFNRLASPPFNSITAAVGSIEE